MTSSSYLKIRRGERKRERERERVMDVLSVFANVLYYVCKRRGNFLNVPNFLKLVLES